MEELKVVKISLGVIKAKIDRLCGEEISETRALTLGQLLEDIRTIKWEVVRLQEYLKEQTKPDKEGYV